MMFPVNICMQQKRISSQFVLLEYMNSLKEDECLTTLLKWDTIPT